jgi:PPM family protein phosphatase
LTAPGIDLFSFFLEEVMENPTLPETAVPESPSPGAPSNSSLTVRSFGLTDRGLVRPSNQDQFLVAELSPVIRVHQSSLSQPESLFGQRSGTLFIVADGMGGHRGGEQASAIAVETIEDFMLNTLKWFFGLKGESLLAEFQDALSAADARLFEEMARHPELRGMGTTVTMAYTVGDAFYVVHVGDSRCYLFREGSLYQLTHDHTLVQELVSHGVVKPEDAPHHRYRHIITNAVGGTEHGIRVEVHKLPLAPGDVALLCSDGLTEMVDATAIATILATEGEPERACHDLVERANALGGRDNVTTVVARFDGLPH